MAPSGYVCCGFERDRMWAVGRKGRNLSEQLENNYLSGARSKWAYFGVVGDLSVIFLGRRRRRNFSKVDFNPLPGLGRQH